MCKIARFREFARQAQANYIYIYASRVCGQNGFLCTLCAAITRVRIVERFAEIYIVVPRPASAQSRRTFDTDTKNNEPGEH